jgi:hypothetical protein
MPPPRVMPLTINSLFSIDRVTPRPQRGSSAAKKLELFTNKIRRHHTAAADSAGGGGTTKSQYTVRGLPLSRFHASRLLSRGGAGDEVDGIPRRTSEAFHGSQERLRQYLSRPTQPLACWDNARAFPEPTEMADKAPCKPVRLVANVS